MKAFSRICSILVLLFGLLSGSFVFAQDSENQPQVYLSAREKAYIVIALKTITYSPYDTPKILKMLSDTMRVQNYVPQSLVVVKSFDEFLRLYRGDSFFQDSNLKLADIGTLFENTKKVKYISNSARVQREIDHYLESRVHFVLEATARIVGFGKEELYTGRDVSFDSIQDFLKDSIEEHVQKFSQELNVNSSKNVLLLSKLLKMYFVNLPNHQKAQILYKLLDLPLNSSPIDVFQVMIQNSGPQMQKLMQIVGRHKDIPEKFQAVFQKLESQVQMVPWKQVEALLKSDGIDLNQFTYFERKPIGVGTMAQTHRAQYIDENGNRVSSVFRFLKPGIEQLLEMDNQILKKISEQIDSDPELKGYKVPSLERIVEDLHRSVVEELKLIDTVNNQTQGRLAYNKTDFIRFDDRSGNVLEFYVPRARLRGTNRNFMEQELIIGSKLTKEVENFTELYPDLYSKVSEKLAEHWLEQVLFKNGFFHADLHQGNLMMRLSDQSIKVYLLDFGMVGQLSQIQRESAMLLALGIKFNNPEVIAKHLGKLTKQSLIGSRYESFLAQVTERTEELKKDTDSEKRSLDSWVLWSIEQGLDLQYDFLKLNRGITAIEAMLADSKSTLSFQDIAQKLPFKNSLYMSSLIMREKLFRFKDFAQMLKPETYTQPKIKTPHTNIKLRCEALFN